MQVKVPEGKIANEICSALKMAGIFCWINKSTGVWDPGKGVFRQNKNSHAIRGVSDILGIIDGRILAIEVKTPTGRPTPEQKEFINNINARGGVAFISRSTEQTFATLRALFPSNVLIQKFAKEFVKESPLDH